MKKYDIYTKWGEFVLTVPEDELDEAVREYEEMWGDDYLRIREEGEDF